VRALFLFVFPVTVVLVGSCGARTDLLVPYCHEGDTRPCHGVCGDGTETCVRGAWTGCTAKGPLEPPQKVTVAGTIRDFHSSHPDFEKAIGDDRGLVQMALGADGTPVFAPSGPTTTVSGKTTFDQWFHDVPGTNMKGSVSLELDRKSMKPLQYGFDAAEYFPIDGMLFGNEGFAHDYHFTIAFRTNVHYGGGETLVFKGDDDLFVFVDQKLALDLGGVHQAETGSVTLDALSLEKGKDYGLDVFFCERHTVDSSLRIETTNASFVMCP
jgi:fibro-slime domain-containing protein